MLRYSTTVDCLAILIHIFRLALLVLLFTACFIIDTIFGEYTLVCPSIDNVKLINKLSIDNLPSVNISKSIPFLKAALLCLFVP